MVTRYIPDPEGRIRRRRIIGAAICIMLVVIGAVIYSAQKSWRVERLAKDARGSIERGDYAEASLKARRALQITPDNLSACKLMAEICERARDADSVAWRERVAELSGDSIESLIACATTAVNFGRFTVAERVLKRVPEAEQSRADFQALSGAVAFDAGRFDDAVRFFSEAARIEPEKPTHRFALGRTQAASEDYLTREQGRRLLTDLTGDAELGVPALRVLITSLESTGEPHAALALSEKLVGTPSHAFPDEIVRLRLLRVTQNSDFVPSLVLAQGKAAKDARPANALLIWMSSENLAADALDWALKRAPAVGRLPGVEPGLASCYLALEDWPALFAISQKGRWEFEYIRRAYRARSMREQRNPTHARTEWELAISTTRSNPEGLTWLARAAIEWKWREEAEQVLWESLNLVPGSAGPVELLKGHYVANGNTVGLKRIAEHLLKVNPANENAQNDLALISLLLGKDFGQALSVTRVLHEKNPDSAAYASSYAFALHCANQSDEALKLLDALSERQLQEPAYAAYYGIVLVANNLPEKARQFLGIAQHASLLPEEHDLVVRALKLTVSAPAPKSPSVAAEITPGFARPSIQPPD